MMLWHDREFANGPESVVEGKPVAQFYGLGGAWAKWPDLDEITEDLGPDTPARKVRVGDERIIFPPPLFFGSAACGLWQTARVDSCFLTRCFPLVFFFDRTGVGTLFYDDTYCSFGCLEIGA